MLRSVRVLAFSASLLLYFWASIASAQDFSNCSVAKGLRSERRGEGHTLFYGSRDIPVQIDCKDMQFMADFIETFNDKNLAVAQGQRHVRIRRYAHLRRPDGIQLQGRRPVSFYNASGTASMAGRSDQSMFGTQPPDAYFWGEEIHKLGPKKYRLVRGNFTTCVQPTPRWDIGSSSITINLDDYALLRNSIFRVKSVPVMYLPLFYYPIQEDDRATGFLLPTYGASTIKGQTLSNAFFWAINRSHDATIFHDWFSKTGQGVGGEYRYVLAPGSQGNSTVQFIDEKATTSTEDGTEQQIPGTRSYSVRGGLVQMLPFRLRGRANVDYFSSIRTEQRLQQDVYRATNRTRRFGGNVTGSYGSYVMSATAERNDIFYPDESYQTNGNLPRVLISRGERRIGKSPLYFGVNGEYASLLRSVTPATGAKTDQSLNRLDFAPALRVPFTKWSFLTANSSLAWRGTYWTESIENSAQVADPIGRKYFDLQTRITGPVFQRIFNTPGGRLRREVQTRHRAVFHDPAGHRDRQLRPDRQDRWHGLPDRRRDAIHVRPQQPALRQEGSLARDYQRDHPSVRLQRQECCAVRSPLPEQLQLRSADELFTRDHPGSRDAHRWAVRRIPH